MKFAPLGHANTLEAITPTLQKALWPIKIVTHFFFFLSLILAWVFFGWQTALLMGVVMTWAGFSLILQTTFTSMVTAILATPMTEETSEESS